jgi:thiol:disulfide interchange protein DsbD
MKPLHLLVVSSVLVLLCGTVAAKPWWMRGIASDDTDFLPPDSAFRVSAHTEGDLVHIRWVIADGYYLYRQKIAVSAESPDLVLLASSWPPGVPRTDPYLGTQEVYLQQVDGTVRFRRSDFGAHPMQIKVTYQGCAEAGLCYLPITKVLFPDTIAPVTAAPSHPWEGVAIISGLFAFLVAGLLLRRGRRLDLPAT